MTMVREMTGEEGRPASSHPHYSPDGRWFWDGTRWRAGGPGGKVWAVPQPVLAAAPPGPPRRGFAALTLALIAAVAVASVAAVTIRGRLAGAATAAHPSAQAIFDLPYSRGVRSAEFQSITPPGGPNWVTYGAEPAWKGSGVIEFAPQHAFSESLLTYAGVVFERNLEAGGVAYQTLTGAAPYQASAAEPYDFRSLGWDGGPAPSSLTVAGQTTIDGQLGWVLKQAYTRNRWVVAERTGDPLKAVISHTTYTFGAWDRAPAIRAPAPADVSTTVYRGAGVDAPGATVSVLSEKVDTADADGDPSGFRTVALEIVYHDTSSDWAAFNNDPSLVTSSGVFAPSTYTSLSPWLRPQVVRPGAIVWGWDGFVVPRGATRFDLLFGVPTGDGLISISVSIPR